MGNFAGKEAAVFTKVKIDRKDRDEAIKRRIDARGMTLFF
jgi:hypothetical protein